MTSLATEPASLRRMKAVALAFLIVAAIVFVVADIAVSRGAPAWVGFVRTGAEAGVVGGLADWFAVTALFRHPLGIPVPHTAIIPRRKAELGDALAEFVSEHFLTFDGVASRVSAAQIPQRVGSWVSEPEGAATAEAELAPLLRGGIELLREDVVRPVLMEVVSTRAMHTPVAPVLGRMLEEVLSDGSHVAVVDWLAEGLSEWLAENKSVVLSAVSTRAPEWTPAWVDAIVADKLHREVCSFASDLASDPEHDARKRLDRALASFAVQLRRDPEVQARIEQAKSNLLSRREVQEAFADVVSAGRRLAMDMLDDPDSVLRVQLRALLADAGRKVANDPALAAAIDGYLANAVATVVTTHHAEITALITETMQTWDGKEAAERVERHAGRDLQFIRINGTVVGSLVGVALHALSYTWGS